MAGGVALTKEFIVTTVPTMLLGKDGNRLELSILNKSPDSFLYIGFGTEIDVFSINNTLPLAPGEVYDASIPPLSALWVLSEEYDVPIVVYFSTTGHSYVGGVLGGKTN